MAATALLPVLGYDLMCLIARRAREEKKSVRQMVLDEKLLTPEQFDRLTSAEAVCSLGGAAKRPGGAGC